MSGETHIKNYYFEDEELIQILKDKNEKVKEGRKINDKLQKEQEKLNTLSHEIQQLKDKLMPLIDEKVRPELELGEFDILQSIELEDDKAKAVVVDQVEEYKNSLKEKKEKENEENTTDGE